LKGVKEFDAIVMNMNVDIFWYIVQRSPYVNRRFGGMFRIHLQDRKLAEQATAVQQV
jgi:hypothetical protein